MKLKNQFLIYLLLANFYVSAQVDWCGTNVNDPLLDGVASTVNQNVSMASFLNEPRLVLKVHFYDINRLDGSNPHPLTETTALNAVAELNRNYNAFNIFFKYDGIDSFNSDIYFQVDISAGGNGSAFHQYLNDNDHYVAGAVNIYSIDDLNGGANAYFNHGTGNGVFTVIGIEHQAIDNPLFPSVLTHEVGHNFSLEHTFECRVPIPGLVICENVTREPFLMNGITPNPDYNADTEGDRIIDTYATPQGYNTTDCIYDDNKYDNLGIPYSLHPPQAENFMGYIFDCHQEFTAGQVAEMRAYINLINNDPALTAIETHPVSILYEPYRGVYLGGLNCTDPPLFQYGFDYEFVDTSLAATYNLPSDYNDISFPTGDVIYFYDIYHGSPIQHFDHTAIKILQLDNVQSRKCWNTGISSLTSGCIVNFIDGVPNGNYTITQQDSLGINSPTLIEDLQPGLYNIQGNYQDGSTEQTMILKTNN